MDPGLAACLACLAVIVVAFVVLVVRVLAAVESARADGRAQERRTADEQLANRDATIRSLRAELEADREADGDGADAARDLVDAAGDVAGAADPRELWRPAPGGAPGAGGDAPADPSPPA